MSGTRYFHEWGEVDRSHRKLAHRGSYLNRVWVSPATLRAARSIRAPAALRAEFATVRAHYNGVRLHEDIGYVCLDDENQGRGEVIRKARQAGLEDAARPPPGEPGQPDRAGTQDVG